MIFTPLPFAGAYTIDLQPYRDERGWFARIWCKEEFGQIGHTKEWVQMNHSVSYQKGTLRGMHFQHAPFREIKMVRCIEGAVLDVIIDIREGSQTFLQWCAVELSAANNRMIYIPEGFAHGFQTLSDNSGLIYHHTESYVPGVEGGIRYDDPQVGIHWPLPVSVISGRDTQHPYLDNQFKGI
jgi:dTDP-4-dehydrorhamnose 3,5-epimerase